MYASSRIHIGLFQKRLAFSRLHRARLVFGVIAVGVARAIFLKQEQICVIVEDVF